MSQKLIFVKSILDRKPILTASMIDYSTGRKIPKTKIGETNDGIRAMYSAKYGCLANGLSYKPWIENGEQVTDSDGTKLTLQQKKEKQWNLPKDYLSAHVNPRNSHASKKDSISYYVTKRWKLQDGTTVFNLGNMDEDLGYHVILDSKYIANSKKEYRNHKFPYAKWYIAQTSETEELKYERNERRSKAFAALHSKEMTDAIKKKFVSLLGISSPRSTLSTEQLHNLLFDYIDSSKHGPGSNLEKFESLYKTLKTKFGREELTARYTLLKAKTLRVINEQGGKYTWIRPDGPVTVGTTYKEAIKFLSDVANHSLIEELLAEIDIKINR